MFSIDSKNIAVLGGATAAFLAGVYVLWGPSEKKSAKGKRDLCPGLVNLGNTCFLNSLLQALSPCTSVAQWLKDFLQYNQEVSADSQSLAHTLSHSLEVLNNESVEYTDEFNPSDILGALRLRRWHIPSDQQDAHELYHVFTETLEEEAAKYPSVLPLFDAHKIEEQDESDYQSGDAAQSRSGTLLPVLPGRGSDQPFRGLLASQLQCTKCAHKCSVKYDTFDSLSLSIPSPHLVSFTSSGVLSLESLLRRYVTSEAVQNVECDGCAQVQKGRSSVQTLLKGDRGDTTLEIVTEEMPKPKATFVKKLTIGKLPSCLCIHVQRLTWLDNGLPLKRFDHVAFPEILNMDSYVYHKRPTRPTSLDVDSRKGLIGGKNAQQHSDCNGNRKKTPSPSPTVTSPYSGPVNLLKALNYTSRTTMNGLCVQSTVSPISRQSPVPSRTNSQVQRLAKAYSMEMAGLTNQNNSYKLTSVVVHLGDVDSGHFITYRRAASDNGQRFPDKWLYTSDTEVKKASLAEVLGADAYMFFYERM